MTGLVRTMLLSKGSCLNRCPRTPGTRFSCCGRNARAFHVGRIMDRMS